MAYTAHVDTFARDNLPPQDQWPAFIFNRPELQYPDRINCVREFLDRWIDEGRGDEPCLISPAETLTYRGLHERVNRICNVLVEGSLMAQSVRFAPDYANNNRAETHNDTGGQMQGNVGDPDDIRFVGCSVNARHSATGGQPGVMPANHIQIAAFMASPQSFNPQVGFTVDACWVRGGVFAINAGSATAGSHVKVINTRFEKPGSSSDGRDPLAAIVIDPTCPRTVSGNTYFDGTPVPVTNG